MSATNRGGTRAPADYYPTPAWCVRRLLEAVPLPGGAWLEPSAGDGAIIRAVNEVRGDAWWWAMELREECRASLVEATAGRGSVRIGDFIAEPSDGYAAVAILNPPFSLALQFVERCLSLAGWVCALERLHWPACAARCDWFRAHMPDVYILPDRPSFTGDGASDMAEYAWFVWPPRMHDRQAASVHLLPSTSAVERKANPAQRDLFARHVEAVAPAAQLSLLGGT